MITKPYGHFGEIMKDNSSDLFSMRCQALYDKLENILLDYTSEEIHVVFYVYEVELNDEYFKNRNWNNKGKI